MLFVPVADFWEDMVQLPRFLCACSVNIPSINKARRSSTGNDQVAVETP